MWCIGTSMSVPNASTSWKHLVAYKKVSIWGAMHFHIDRILSFLHIVNIAAQISGCNYGHAAAGMYSSNSSVESVADGPGFAIVHQLSGSLESNYLQGLSSAAVYFKILLKKHTFSCGHLPSILWVLWALLNRLFDERMLMSRRHYFAHQW